ncbi:ABC transporter ATP-binding protein [Bradyrhizobium diazoefficiens]|uniref:ABC transporter ATP-binding protein n=1 Tax=Bradyrhizobium diazoefficiens TaxID=1355477 RepID=UPI001B8D9ACE|nr:ABC transporter ATP-binding protein [Bradyrhizobium diazoefficiens]MBR0863513.1 ABC transporter ATP-binding protein [Bradyrhizobium diazoefficiens]MBR0888198.1 ABC transporter ATP-binding protein [Bradyrhizobium diazoefficiens]MBR0919839.1 ABC transporter ATP-binding protein [Bradyrhizobium diazoefficiens]
MSAVVLSARGLTKSYGALRVTDNLEFDVVEGEVLGILGPNGAGKTTLFNLISGDVRMDSGRLEYYGDSLEKEAPFRRARRGIGRTYQIPRPYSAMSTFENLLVAAMFSAGRKEHEAYGHCAAILDDCGLSERANVLAGSLTLLDRKRLELARALAGQPKLLLLDEIAGGLTEAESATLVQLVRRIRDRGITIVWIEHVIHAIMAVADRMLVLNFGQKIAEGSPSAVMADKEVRRVYMGIEA